ncbi:hypothetical protein [Streptomyces sp. NBC_00094]|uniref:hypothetical protein n=1 Tax=Streptomyces sp. NBC_00094 TaxID=2903620 RepID=UPI00224EAF27|nr:hypothetical protein [Streptomyces sp. NBC_00094]MCX5394934.1 hypothetical protein [Streptomyces sp. NBC_00094]
MGDKRQSRSLDPAHRFTAFTTETKQPDGTWANSTSKLNHYGDDSDEPPWIIEDTTQGTLTRNVYGDEPVEPELRLVARSDHQGLHSIPPLRDVDTEDVRLVDVAPAHRGVQQHVPATEDDLEEILPVPMRMLLDGQSL